MKFTNEQVEAQRIRFDAFMETANLTKIGKNYMKHMVDGREFMYIHKVLGLLAHVRGSMYHPNKLNDGYRGFYSSIIECECVNAFINSLSKCCCETKGENIDDSISAIGTSNCCPIHNNNPHKCYSDIPCK